MQPKTTREAPFESLREKLELEQVIMNHLNRMSQLLVSQRADQMQFHSCVEFLRALLTPYTDSQYNKAFKQITDAAHKSARPLRDWERSELNAICVWQSQAIFEQLNGLIRRLGLGLESTGEENAE